MFITIGGFTNWMSGDAGKVLIDSGVGIVASAHDAAECVDRYVINGSPLMQEINEHWNRIYRNPLSARDVLIPVPNEAMRGYRPHVESEELEDDLQLDRERAMGL